MNITTRNGLRLFFILTVLVYGLAISVDDFGYSFSQGPNNRNVSVDTTVNITESLPTVLDVLINGGETNLTLNAGGTLEVECNASIRDYNGGATITDVSATFYDQLNSNDTDVDDNNTHYSNASCTGGTPDGYFRNFTCTFDVLYYANVGMWVCNVTATDSYAFNESVNPNASNFNVTHIDEIFALNVTTLIDYGDLAVGDTSSPQEANVTNIGNTNINISVEGYGATLDDGLAMVCDVGNISIEYEMYNLVGGVDTSLYANLSSTATQIVNLTIPQQTNDSQQEINATYWLLYVPPNPFGICNGTVIFQAEAS
ncbi:MAG: hypothetical protein OXR66_07285 [Candidatus Woesearchaeota archaeon]|nr:hypothetical protein [Candidatus Woesearchaeota archaeon]